MYVFNALNMLKKIQRKSFCLKVFILVLYLFIDLFYPDSVGLWLFGCHSNQPGISTWSPVDPAHQEAIFPQSADLLHRPGHWDTLLQRCTSAHTRGK